MHFKSYYWSQGKPIGLSRVAEDAAESFKIISDPYYKRFSLERYKHGRFVDVIYDSAVFDFRLLKAAAEAAWRREVLEETPTITRSLIRNIEERIILIEEAHFQDNVCRLCTIHSPHYLKIASQSIFYKKLGDAFDGVLLIDLLNQPILIKRYAVDPDTQEFSTLLDEIWDHAP